MNKKECKYCLSDIPKKALKCKFCLEWQDKNKEDLQDKKEGLPQDLVLNEVGLQKPFQLKLVENKRLTYPVVVFIVGILLFVILQFSWYKLNEDKIYLLSFFAFAVQLMVSWSCLIWIYQMINKNYGYFICVSSTDSDNANDLFYKFQKKIFNTRNSILVGLLVGLSASFGDYYIGTPFVKIEAKLLFGCFEFIYMFFAGAAIYSVIQFGKFLFKLTSKKDGNLMTINQKRSIHRIGNLHLKTSVIAIVPLFLGVIGKLFGNWPWDLLVVLWYGVFVIAIILYIYLPIINIHDLMNNDLEKQLYSVQNKIRKKLKDINIDPSSSNFMKLNDLRGLENSLSSQTTWPFDTKSLSAAFAALIAPIILLIIDKFWPL